MEAIHQIPEEQIVVIRNGVDTQRFKPDPMARDEVRTRVGVTRGGRVALFIGSGFRRKGLRVAGEAFAKVARRRDRLVVAGRDAHAKRWIQPLRERLGDRLVVVGEVARPERWMASADATLLPTLYDAAANTTLESLASGVPAITSAMDGSAEVVPDPALVVEDPRDVDGFARALEYAWAAGPELGVACREAVADLTWEKCCESVWSVYQEVARD